MVGRRFVWIAGLLIGCETQTPTPDSVTREEPEGCLDCACDAEGSCDGELVCYRDTCLTCLPGAEDCECRSGQCDGGLQCSADNFCEPLPYRRVFVTSVGWDGRLRTHGPAPTGTEAADVMCQRRASAANLGGNWKAWISGDGQGAKDRLQDVGPWHRLDSGLVAESMSDLVTGPRLGIDVNEFGEVVPAYWVWTGTGPSGREARFNGVEPGCSGSGGDFPAWTQPDRNGLVGSAGATSEEWTDLGYIDCDQVAALYCFERGADQ